MALNVLEATTIKTKLINLTNTVYYEDKDFDDISNLAQQFSVNVGSNPVDFSFADTKMLKDIIIRALKQINPDRRRVASLITIAHRLKITESAEALLKIALTRIDFESKDAHIILSWLIDALIDLKPEEILMINDFAKAKGLMLLANIIKEKIPTELTIGETTYRFGDKIDCDNLKAVRTISGFKKEDIFHVYGSIYNINLETQEIKVFDSAQGKRYIVKISDLEQKLSVIDSKLPEDKTANTKVEIAGVLKDSELNISSVYQSEEIYKLKKEKYNLEIDEQEDEDCDAIYIKEVILPLVTKVELSANPIEYVQKLASNGIPAGNYILKEIIDYYPFFPREVAVAAYETLINIKDQTLLDYHFLFLIEDLEVGNIEALFTIARIADRDNINSKFRQKLIQKLSEYKQDEKLGNHAINALKLIRNRAAKNILKKLNIEGAKTEQVLQEA